MSRAEAPTWLASRMPLCTCHQAEGVHHAAPDSFCPQTMPCTTCTPSPITRATQVGGQQWHCITAG